MRIYAPRLALIISLLKYASLSSSLILSRKSANVQEYQRSSRLFLTFPSSKRNDLPSKQFQSSTSDLDNVRHFEDKFPQIDKHSTPEFDSILSDYNDDLQSDIILFTDDQRFDSLLRAKSDSHGISGLHFAATLKTLAARRYHLDGSYNSEKRKQLIRTLSAQIAHKRVHLDEDSRTEFVEMLSNCVWALGTLKFSKEDFLPPTSQNLNGDTARLKKITNESNSWELLVSAAAQVCDDPKFYAKGDTRASDVPVYCISRVQLFRLISGLGKMGLKWKAMPPQLRDQFVWHTSHLCSGPRYAGGGYSSNLTDAEMGGNILKGCDVDTSLAVAAVTDSGSDSDNGSDRDVSIDPSREVASALYILGQVGATKEVLPEEYLQALIAQLNQDHVIQGFTAPGLFNALHGLARLQFCWDSDIPATLQRRLLERATRVLISSTSSKLEEFCSFLKSIAVLKVNWDDLSPNLQTAIVRTMLLHLPAMSCRETIVSVWSLGKLGVSFKELNKITATEAATTGTSAEGDAISSSTALTGGITDTNIYIGSDANTDTNTATSDLRAGMLSKLEVVAPQMTVFDSESLLLALGLMEAQFNQFSASYVSTLRRRLLVLLPHMNIFNLHNVLWGLARIKADIHAQGPAVVAIGGQPTVGGSKAAQASTNLGAALLESVLDKLHTFRPVHYGDLMWSLGSLGFTVEAQSTVTTPQLQRTLAVLSRVFNQLPVRGATYVLWGLARMGVRWKEHLSVCPPRTVAEYSNRTFTIKPVPLSDSIAKYLNTRVGSLREHEFAVVLAAMGKMGASWEDLPDPLPGKLSHRITRVGPYFSSRSLSNALQGLAQMRVVWGNLRQPSRDSLQKALLQSQSDTMPKTAVSTPSASTATATAAADGTSAGGSASEVYTRPMPLPLPNMRCGLQGMRNKELATAIFSLGSMKAEWSTLSAPLQDEIVQSVAKRSYSRNVHLQDAHVNTGGKMGTTLDYEFTAAHTLVGLSGMNCPADLIPLPLVTATATQLRQLHQLCSCSPLDKHQKSLYLELIKGQIYVDKGNGYFTNSGLLAGVLKADLRAWLHDAVIVSTSQLRESEAEAPEAAAVVEQATEVETDQQQLPPLSEEDVRLQEQKEAWLALIHKRSETVPQNPQHVSVTPAPAPPPTPAAAPALYDPSVAVAALSALADLGGSWQELSLQCKEAVVGLLAQAHKYTEERKHQQPASASSNNSTTNCGVAVAPSKVKGGAFSASLLQELFTAVTRLRQNKMQYIN